MKLAWYVALLWPVRHLPDHFAEEGWGVEALIAGGAGRGTLRPMRRQVLPRLIAGTNRSARPDRP
jgi:hypothetical protein